MRYCYGSDLDDDYVPKAKKKKSTATRPVVSNPTQTQPPLNATTTTTGMTTVMRNTTMSRPTSPYLEDSNMDTGNPNMKEKEEMRGQEVKCEDDGIHEHGKLEHKVYDPRRLKHGDDVEHT
jgi:hypothetical protein